jgi:hypothetical protein
MTRSKIKDAKVPAVTIVKNMRDYDNEPFFVKKKEQAMDLLLKYGLPDGTKFKWKGKGLVPIKPKKSRTK